MGASRLRSCSGAEEIDPADTHNHQKNRCQTAKCSASCVPYRVHVLLEQVSSPRFAAFTPDTFVARKRGDRNSSAFRGGTGDSCSSPLDGIYYRYAVTQQPVPKWLTWMTVCSSRGTKTHNRQGQLRLPAGLQHKLPERKSLNVFARDTTRNLKATRPNPPIWCGVPQSVRRTAADVLCASGCAPYLRPHTHVLPSDTWLCSAGSGSQGAPRSEEWWRDKDEYQTLLIDKTNPVREKGFEVGTVRWHKSSTSRLKFTGPWTEERFFDFWMLKKPKIERVYLPIQWSGNEPIGNPQWRELNDMYINELLQSLDRAYTYFTVIQVASAFENTISNWRVPYDLNLTVYSTGPTKTGTRIVPIPLLKEVLEPEMLEQPAS